MATSLDESLLELVAWQSSQPNYLEPTANLRQALSEADIASYRVLENNLYSSEFEWGSLERRRRGVEEAFNSPLYGDACKEYFVAAHMSDKLVVLAGDRFLTEKIILGYLEGPKTKSFDLAYFTVLMGSVHLSEPILVALFISAYNKMQVSKALAVIPDRMITSKVIATWLAYTSWVLVSDPMAVAALRVKQTHPEYEGFPDEWVLRVFCGD